MEQPPRHSKAYIAADRQKKIRILNTKEPGRFTIAFLLVSPSLGLKKPRT